MNDIFDKMVYEDALQRASQAESQLNKHVEEIEKLRRRYDILEEKLEAERAISKSSADKMNEIFRKQQSVIDGFERQVQNLA